MTQVAAAERPGVTFIVLELAYPVGDSETGSPSRHLAEPRTQSMRMAFIVRKIHIAFIEEEADVWGVESIDATDWLVTLVDTENREFAPTTGVAEYIRRDDRFENRC